MTPWKCNTATKKAVDDDYHDDNDDHNDNDDDHNDNVDNCDDNDDDHNDNDDNLAGWTQSEDHNIRPFHRTPGFSMIVYTYPCNDNDDNDGRQVTVFQWWAFLAALATLYLPLVVSDWVLLKNLVTKSDFRY